MSVDAFFEELVYAAVDREISDDYYGESFEFDNTLFMIYDAWQQDLDQHSYVAPGVADASQTPGVVGSAAKLPGISGRQKHKRRRKRAAAALVNAEEGRGPPPHERPPHKSVLKQTGAVLKLGHDSALKMHIANGAWVGKHAALDSKAPLEAAELVDAGFEFYEWDGV